MVQELPRRAVRAALWAALAFLGGCRGEARPTSEDEALQRSIDSVVPMVEQATGLKFKRHPRGRMIDRATAGAYIARQLDRQLGDGSGESMAAVYRLLGLLPDSLDLRRLYESVLTEQVAGYYDPEQSLFFGVRGNPVGMRLLISHELVHALQHDYVPLDSLMNARGNADRILAAHAMLEGQAMFASTRMNPEAGDRVLEPEFWETARTAGEAQLSSMPALGSAPRVIRDGVTFPYFEGAMFISRWTREHPSGEMPYGAKLPRSTEEILAPERAAAGDRPLEVTLVGGPAAEYSDVMGAAGLRLLLAIARNSKILTEPVILGWGGDRYALYGPSSAPALVWIAVFDGPSARDRALRALADWPPPRAGYKRMTVPLEVSGRPGLRLIVAPNDWGRWSALPTATAAPE